MFQKRFGSCRDFSGGRDKPKRPSFFPGHHYTPPACGGGACAAGGGAHSPSLKFSGYSRPVTVTNWPSTSCGANSAFDTELSASLTKTGSEHAADTRNGRAGRC